MAAQTESWIKFYRKICDHAVFDDPTALRVFLWMLCKADYQTGTLTVSRRRTAKILSLNPSTFRDALVRLQAHHLLDVNPTTSSYTTIRLLQWDKYQPQNFSPSLRRQSDDTYIRNKNKENKEMDKERKEKSPHLNAQEQEIAGRITRWLVNPYHNLEWRSGQADSFSEKIVATIGASQALRAYDRFANSTNPDARGFMQYVKEVSHADAS